MVEFVGYLGSALIITSLLMTRILRLSELGLIGAATFLTYGLLIGSVPIMITNTDMKRTIQANKIFPMANGTLRSHLT